MVFTVPDLFNGSALRMNLSFRFLVLGILYNLVFVIEVLRVVELRVTLVSSGFFTETVSLLALMLLL